MVKVRSGRRPRDTLPAAWFWIAVYGAVGALHVLGLVLRGFGYVLYLRPEVCETAAKILGV